MTDSGKRTKTSGRRGRASRIAARADRSAVRAPYITRKLGTYDVLDEEGLGLIEHNADVLLKETGMEFTGDPEILDIFRSAGADVKGERVRFEPGMCRQLIQATAPAEFVQHARNPATTSRSAAPIRCCARPGGRPSCTTSMTGGATRRTRTSASWSRSTR